MQPTCEELFEIGICINVIVPEKINYELWRAHFTGKDSVTLEEVDVV
jgi:hypothetical protein